MVLPHPRTDGTLPPGQHTITNLSDLFAAFPATTARRRMLDVALTRLVEAVRDLALGTSLVIDGSYTTGKAEPEDVDVAMLSTGADETVTLQRLQAEGVDLNLRDVFVLTTQPDFERWVQFFSADRTGQVRGVLLLAI